MRVFYVMEFKTNVSEYKQIVDSCRNEGIYVSRAVSTDVNDLHRTMYNGLGQADAIMADISTDRRNVWYELGLLHGIGKHFVLVSNDIDSLPFNISTCNVIDMSRPAFVKDVVARLKRIQSLESAFTDDNPFLSAFENSPFKSRLSYAHGTISKVGSIDIQEDAKSIQIHIKGKILNGLTQIVGTEIKFLALGCNLNKWGWRGRDWFAFKGVGADWHLTIAKTWLLRFLYKTVSNQFRFSIYARTVNGECIYLDLEKFNVPSGYLRDDGYSGKVLMTNL